MAWRVHGWSPDDLTGSVVSPHLGPWPFGPDQNPYGTLDFEPGEKVIVELDQTATGYLVRSVVAMRQRQPAGTTLDVFADLNARRHGDMRVEETPPGTLQVWVGDCCNYCGESTVVTFRGVERVVGLDDELDLDSPLFRAASAEEAAEAGLALEPNLTAFCIVISHGTGRDGPRIVIQAAAVELEHHPRVRR